MNVLSLFSGIGGLDLGLERAGFRTIGQVEINPFNRQVLTKHWPEVPKHGDVRTALDWWRSEPRPAVDVVAGGYLCQSESVAGLRLGTDDERWLWPEMARIIHALRPRLVIGENVLGHRNRGLRFVLRDFERLGYTATAGHARACEMGAPHPRPRLFILAYANGQGWSPRCRLEQTWAAPVRTGWWAAEPAVGRVAYGLPDRVDRVTALGNAVVPALAEYIGRIALAGFARGSADDA